jgi:hypothetical protein
MKLLIRHIIFVLFSMVLVLSIVEASDTTKFSDFHIFPERKGNALSVGFYIGGGLNSSTSNNLESSSFINNRAFQQTPILGMKDSKTRYPFSGSFRGNHPINNNLRIAFDLEYQTKYPIDFGFDLSFDFIREIIFNEQKQLFLNTKMLPEEFIERTMIINDEVLIKSGTGLYLPILEIIQGDSRRIDRISKQYLSLYMGISIATPLKSRANQYLQINDNDLLRYKNGTDTLIIINDQKFSTSNSFRSYFDAKISWRLSERMNFGADLYFTHQLNSLLEDNDWKQWFLGIKFSFIIFNNYWRKI